MTKTILITGIGGDIAQGVAQIIKESKSEIILIGTDTNFEHAGSLYVDEVVGVPRAKEENYLDSINDVINKYSIETVIPITEAELSVFSPFINELGIDRCITAGENVINIGIDKVNTMNAIAALGIPTPWTIQSEKELPTKYPCVFKARTGSGSKNIFQVKDREEAIYLSKKFNNSIFQELLEPADKEITCAVYRGRDGGVAVLQLLRKLTGGLTSWCKVINDHNVLKMCNEIAIGLDLKGSMNIQLRITEFGPRVFEINPRFSSTVLMRHRLGFSDLLWALDETEGKSIDFPKVRTRQCMVRVQNAEKIK